MGEFHVELTTSFLSFPSFLFYFHRYASATYGVTVYQSFLVLTTILAGGTFFSEFDEMKSYLAVGLFGGGVALTICGLLLLSYATGGNGRGDFADETDSGSDDGGGGSRRGSGGSLYGSGSLKGYTKGGGGGGEYVKDGYDPLNASLASSLGGEDGEEAGPKTPGGRRSHGRTQRAVSDRITESSAFATAFPLAWRNVSSSRPSAEQEPLYGKAERSASASALLTSGGS